MKIGNKELGVFEKCFIVAEIGINHNGDLNIAKQLIDVAKDAGCDAVKFQKRTVDVVYTKEELLNPRKNPFGETNGDLKRGLEFGQKDYEEINKYCVSKNILWFASCWDEQAVDFIDQFDTPCYKIASASLTDDNLIAHTVSKNKPILLSTGMSTLKEIEHAMDRIEDKLALIYQCTSTYPTNLLELDLEVMNALSDIYEVPAGFSGHELGITASVLAAQLGAQSIEKHITLDKNMWGSDQKASIEPQELKDMVMYIRNLPKIIGDGNKKLYDSELPIIDKLRRIKSCQRG